MTKPNPSNYINRINAVSLYIGKVLDPTSTTQFDDALRSIDKTLTLLALDMQDSGVVARLTKPVTRITPLGLDFHDAACWAANYYGMTLNQVQSPKRTRQIARTRQAVCWFLRSRLGISTVEIGRLIHRDHSTVIYAWQTIERERTINPEFRRELDAFVAAWDVAKAEAA